MCTIKFEAANQFEDATFSAWLNGRRPRHLSTNTGTDPVAFQSWRNFKEAFAPELIGQAFEETANTLGRAVEASVDPFGGSGTTALASQFLGVYPTTVEVNPFLADLIEAKLASYDIDALLDDYGHLLDDVKPSASSELFPGAPATFVEPGPKGRYLYKLETAQAIAGLRDGILRIANPVHRRLFRVILGCICVELSNVVVSGKGRRYKRNWQTRESFAIDVVPTFDAAFTQAVYDLHRFRNRRTLQYNITRGDVRSVAFPPEIFDIAVFSPPYPNSFDYTDVYNVELWVCGYFCSGLDNRAHRERTLRSHVQIKRSYTGEAVFSDTLPVVRERLDQVTDQLWNGNPP